MVAWNKGSVFRLNLDTLVWSTSGAAYGEGCAWDIFGRFAYSPIKDASFAFATAEENVDIFKNAH